MLNINLMTADAFIIIVVFLSVFVGFLRGATKEVLSLLSWVGSIFLTIIIFPHAKNIARENISHGLIADFVTACVLFVIFLTILSVLNYACSSFIKKSALNSVDKFLGAVFGVVRGVILVAVVDIAVCQWFVAGDTEPNWLADSKFRPQVMKVANFMILIMPNSIQDMLISRMSIVNKENLLQFLKKDVIDDAIDLTAKSLISKEAIPAPADILLDNENEVYIAPKEADLSQEEEAKKLATLTPREVDEVDRKQAINSRKTEKEKLDMQRVLDATDLKEDEQ